MRWLLIVPSAMLIIGALAFAGVVLVLDLWQLRSRHAASSSGYRLGRPAEEQTGMTEADFRRLNKIDFWFGWGLLAMAILIALSAVLRMIGWLFSRL